MYDFTRVARDTETSEDLQMCTYTMRASVIAIAILQTFPRGRKSAPGSVADRRLFADRALDTDKYFVADKNK